MKIKTIEEFDELIRSYKAKGKAEIKNLHLVNLDFTNRDLSKLWFYDIYIENCVFKDTNLHDTCFFTNSVSFVRSCDFKFCDLSDASLHNLIFEDCDFQYANLKDASIIHSSFENCNFMYADINIGRSSPAAIKLFEAYRQIKLCEYETIYESNEAFIRRRGLN